MEEIKIQRNSRQIPSKKEVCSNKKYHDIIYGWLQEASERDEVGNRYVNEKCVNFTAIGKMINLSRQTVAKKIKNLEEMGLIVKNDGKKRYDLILLSAGDATLIPQKTLNFLVNSQSEKGISIYVYLFNRFYANGYSEFSFYMNQIKSFIGLSTAYKNNNDVIKDCLTSLENNGLIEFSVEDEIGDDGLVKTLYKIHRVNIEYKEKISGC